MKEEHPLTMKCPNHPDRQASRSLGYCGECAAYDYSLISNAIDVHSNSRESMGLVRHVPGEGPSVCLDCGNHCRLDTGDIGFCHTREGVKSGVARRFDNRAIVSSYFDPLPTNCVADWVCPITKSRELGHGRSRLKNLAVFYGSCNSDCLFCQNSNYQIMMKSEKPLMTPEELADVADANTACVCYFGGDPACNPIHSLETSELLFAKWQTRVCYETNGNLSGKWLERIAGSVRESGGTIKFDLKAISPNLYRTLTGIRNNVVLKNFRQLAGQGKGRDGEFLVASILLIPGYINLKEIELLCGFIAVCDPTIPTALLGFSPHHQMIDLPRTSRRHAADGFRIARECGLENVRIGNEGLLSSTDYRYD
ncbi:MAG: radical SAM protein [Candidatus Thorarchaeota archaeon]|nr:radical SAM protein [Candidatus Thorarchaeota archaeon]